MEPGQWACAFGGDRETLENEHQGPDEEAGGEVGRKAGREHHSGRGAQREEPCDGQPPSIFSPTPQRKGNRTRGNSPPQAASMRMRRPGL